MRRCSFSCIINLFRWMKILSEKCKYFMDDAFTTLGHLSTFYVLNLFNAGSTNTCCRIIGVTNDTYFSLWPVAHVRTVPTIMLIFDGYKHPNLVVALKHLCLSFLRHTVYIIFVMIYIRMAAYRDCCYSFLYKNSYSYFWATIKRMWSLLLVPGGGMMRITM